MNSVYGDRAYPAGFPHSGIHGSGACFRLTVAFRRSLRPSSAPSAKASPLRSFQLDLTPSVSLRIAALPIMLRITFWVLLTFAVRTSCSQRASCCFTFLLLFIQFSRYTAARSSSRSHPPASQVIPPRIPLDSVFATPAIPRTLKQCPHRSQARPARRSRGGLNVSSSPLEPLSSRFLSVPILPGFLPFWEVGGLKWTRTTDLTLIRRAL